MSACLPERLPHPIIEIRQILAGHYRRLSARSRALRFLSPIREPGIEKLASAANPEFVLAVEIDGLNRAILEAFRLSSTHAEIGLSVEDPFQGHGYGSRLLMAGISEARKAGFESLSLFFSSQNKATLKLCRAWKATFEREGGCLVAHISLSRASSIESS